MKKCTLFTVAAAALLAWGSDYDYAAEDKPAQLGDGALVFTWDNDAISSLSKTDPGAARLSSAAGDTLLFAPNAFVSLLEGSLEFDLPLEGNGALTFSHSQNIKSYDGVGLSGKNELKVFENLDLDEWTPYCCLYDKNKLYPQIAISGKGMPYHIVRGDGTLNVQFQCIDRGFAKSVRVDFRQEGPDVYAKIGHVMYTNNISLLGADFDTLEGAGQYHVSADGQSGNGYSVDYIEMIPAADSNPHAILTRSISGIGVITNRLAGGLVFSGDKSLSENGEYDGDFYAERKIVFKNHLERQLRLSGDFYGADYQKIVFDGADCDMDDFYVPASSIHVDGNNTAKYTDQKGNEVTYTYFHNTWVPFAKDVPLSAIESVKIDIGGPNIKTFDDVTAKLVRYNEGTATKWFQASVYDNPWYKCLNLEIREVRKENGSLDLEIRAKTAFYCKWTNVPGASDEEKLAYIIPSLEDAKAKEGGEYSQSGYGAKNADVSCGAYTRKRFSLSTLSGANHITGGIVEVAGANETCRTILTVSHAHALPPGGSLEIRNHGIVELNAKDLSVYTGYRDGSCTMNIHPGGELRQVGALVVFGSTGQTVNNDGGRLIFGHNVTPGGLPHEVDSKTYIRYLNLFNGAVVDGALYPRVSYGRPAHWKSSGNAPNTVNCGITLVGHDGGAESEFMLTCTSDLVLNGKLCTYGNLYPTGDPSLLTNCVITKYGPAKVIQNGDNIVHAPIRIYEGAWVLGKSNAVFASKRFELYGGGLALADHVAQTLDILPLAEGDTCALALGEGASLELGAIGFGEGTALSVTGPDVRDGGLTRLRVGTSACLDKTALSKIRYNARRVEQNADGWIRTATGATVILVK